MNQVVINRHSQHGFSYALPSHIQAFKKWEYCSQNFSMYLQDWTFVPSFKIVWGKGTSGKCVCMCVIFFLIYVSFSAYVCLLGLLRRPSIILSFR